MKIWRKVGSPTLRSFKQSLIFRKPPFSCCAEVGVVNPVKFTRDSGWLACYDEFLVISEGYHVDLHICSFLIVGHCAHCTSWCEVISVVN